MVYCIIWDKSKNFHSLMEHLEFQEKIKFLIIFQIIKYLFGNKYLYKKYFCYYCKRSCFFTNLQPSIDSYAYWCINSLCNNYNKYSNIRKGNFLENLNRPLN
ncbi:hypothetical protein DMUE_2109 [Dictyocoela muelleri]|nr:hypothetical protein DMUE_2109 [Dictyocoela muelleri]